MPARPKVLVAMSGGVDSSVAAALLQDQGYEVVGCFMRLGSDPAAPEVETPDACAPSSPDSKLSGGETRNSKLPHSGCCSVHDAADARLVAAILNIPFYVLNFQRDFGRVIDYFVAEYNAGRTPNPCVRCNDWLKFGKLADYARAIDAEFIATGHYARIERDPRNVPTNRVRLLRGVDLQKDQSYVLFGTRRAMLARMVLPIGDLHKSEVRALAQARGLPVFDKPDSQEICFVPDDDYAGLIARRTPAQLAPGTVLDPAGRALGAHPGHQHYTIGQRRGLGVATGVPLYVIAKDPAANTVTVGPKEHLLAVGLRAEQTNWLVDVEGSPPEGFTPGRVQGSGKPDLSPRRSGSGPEPAGSAAPRSPGIPCLAQIRAHAPPVPATLFLTGPTTLELRFAQPQSAVSPGQAVVCYAGDELLGGGWITEALRA